MNKLFISFVGLALLIGIVGCKHDKGNDSMGSMKMEGGNSMSDQPTTMPAKMMYTCTMHPEVVSDKPGNCPKCGMALVPKK